MTVETRLITAEEFFRMPGGSQYELVRGELVTMSPAGTRHGKIASRIDAHLRRYVTENALGETYANDTGFILSREPDSVRGPDVAFVRAERVLDLDGFFPGPPDLAIEVISPSDLYTDVNAKLTEYLRAGTRAVVIVDPKQKTVRVHRSLDHVVRMADVLEVDDVVPGWKMPLAEIFD